MKKLTVKQLKALPHMDLVKLREEYLYKNCNEEELKYFTKIERVYFETYRR